MGVQVVDEDSVGLTLAKEQPSSMRCTRRVPQSTSQCTTFQPQHRLQMFSFAGLYTLFDSKHCVSCWLTVQSFTHHTDSDGLEERDPNPHVGDCHSCAESIFPCVEQPQRQDAPRESERDTPRWCAVLSSRGAQGEVPENQHMFKLSAQPCVQSFPAASDASNNQRVTRQ